MNYSSLLSPIAMAALLGDYWEKPGQDTDWLTPDTVQAAPKAITGEED